MSSAIEILLAKSLAQSLSLVAWPVFGFRDCVFEYVPEFEGTDLSTLRVSVVPGTLEVTTDTRAADLHAAEVHVVIAKHFATASELESLIGLRADIQDAIRSRTLPESTPPIPGGVSWRGMEIQQTFDRDALSSKRLFMASIAVTYHVLVDKVTA